MSEGRNRWVDRVVEKLGGWDGDWVWSFLQYELAGALAVGAFGWYICYSIERRHLARLSAREADLQDISITQTPALPPGFGAGDSTLLVASVVLSRGSFRMIFVAFRKLLGGRIPGYTLLLERARREALVRLKEAARERGAPAVINLRLETTQISSKGMPVVEIMAYGTALAIGRGGAAPDSASNR